MRILLDNDVVLDFVLEREPFFADAEMIFQYLDNGDIECYVSAITPINVFYTTRKLRDKDIALQAVKDLLVAVKVCRTDKLVLQTAFALNFTDYEDAVQCVLWRKIWTQSLRATRKIIKTLSFKFIRRRNFCKFFNALRTTFH